MSKASVNKLFVNNDKSNDEHSMMNIGQHCSQCQELDFLPFVCEYCGATFCSKHRTIELHHCAKAPKEKTFVSQRYTGPTAASLFPNRDANRQQIEAKLQQPSKPTNILGSNAGKGNVFATFTKFMNLQKIKNNSKKKFFKKAVSFNSTNKVLEAAAIRKEAKGDAKINVSDRIHVWCVYINPREKAKDQSSEDEVFSNLNVEKERRACWVSKQWSVGRALDSIADTIHIVNHNNSTNDADEKLHLFKVNETETPVLLKLHLRCKDTLQQGDTLYLVRGHL